MDVPLQPSFATCLSFVLQVGRFSAYEVIGPYRQLRHQQPGRAVLGFPPNGLSHPQTPAGRHLALRKCCQLSLKVTRHGPNPPDGGVRMYQVPHGRLCQYTVSLRRTGLAERQPDPPVAVVIPPRSTAVPSPNAGTRPSQRDQHIHMIQAKGRLGWHKAVGYGRRSHAETAMFRYKTIIGSGLRARILPAQNTETKVACSVLNRMTRLGMPMSQRIC